jgi:hypothetical protein
MSNPTPDLKFKEFQLQKLFFSNYLDLHEGLSSSRIPHSMNLLLLSFVGLCGSVVETEPECITVPDPVPEPDLDPDQIKYEIKKVTIN